MRDYIRSPFRFKQYPDRGPDHYNTMPGWYACWHDEDGPQFQGPYPNEAACRAAMAPASPAMHNGMLGVMGISMALDNDEYLWSQPWYSHVQWLYDLEANFYH